MKLLVFGFGCCIGLIISLPFTGLAIEVKNDLFEAVADSNAVIDLNKKGYDNRLNNSEQSLAYADQALKIAKSIGYKNGEAEAYRIRGISKYYLNQTENAIADYLTSLSIFKTEHNRLGQAKVLNNIGNLYLLADYDKALDYFNEALELGKTLGDKDLMGNLFLNIGNIYVRKKKYTQALSYYEKGDAYYKQTENLIGIIHGLQNRGKIYHELNQLKEAEDLLLEANKKAKAQDLNGIVASINLTLTSVYILKKEFKKAANTLNEGLTFAKLVKDKKLIYDYQYTSYELEYQLKNFEKALYYLRMVYKQDSIHYRNSESAKIGLLQMQFKQKELQKENELITLRQRQGTIILISTIIVTFMSIAVIILLTRSMRRKAKSNKELTRLNKEVSIQKDNLNRINLHLEELINERTIDLRIKNQKLSEYSAHLSHEIRGPVASMKGLMILEEDKLIEHQDLIEKMRICINQMDDRIHRLNEMLNNPQAPNLSGEKSD